MRFIVRVAAVAACALGIAAAPARADDSPADATGGGGAWPELFDNIGRHFLVVDIDAEGHPTVSVTRVD